MLCLNNYFLYIVMIFPYLIKYSVLKRQIQAYRTILNIIYYLFNEIL